MQTWQEIWSQRGGGDKTATDLQALIELDGYDGAAAKVLAPDWQAYANAVARLLRMGTGDSLFEVGCGAGAFLYAMREAGLRIAGGIDSSDGLVKVAGRHFPGAELRYAEAMELDVEPPCDFVLANSVFHYFPSFDYAANVLERMCRKTLKAVAVLDVPDQASEGESERVRRGMLGEEEYARKYAELKHLYYPRAWFVDRATAEGLKCEIVDQFIPNCAQSRFRFNCVIWKASDYDQA